MRIWHQMYLQYSVKQKQTVFCSGLTFLKTANFFLIKNIKTAICLQKPEMHAIILLTFHSKNEGHKIEKRRKK